MNPHNNFDAFYEQLLPSLDGLKKECREADSWGIAALLAAVFGFGAFLSYYGEIISGDVTVMLLFLFAIIFVLSIYFYAKTNDSFTGDYKTQVIQQIIDYTYPGFVYTPDTYISEQEYVYSSASRYRHSYFSGEDYITGEYNGVDFRCSEISAQDDRRYTIFSGLFFVAPINPQYSACTYLWIQGFEQLAVSVMDEHYRLLTMPDVTDVGFNDKDFDYYFRTCSTDPLEATAILTTSMRVNLVKFVKEINRPVHISFVMGNCYIAIPFAEDLLEVGAYAVTEKSTIQKHYDIISLIPLMIDILQLKFLR